MPCWEGTARATPAPWQQHQLSPGRSPNPGAAPAPRRALSRASLGWGLGHCGTAVAQEPKGNSCCRPLRAGNCSYTPQAGLQQHRDCLSITQQHRFYMGQTMISRSSARGGIQPAAAAPTTWWHWGLECSMPSHLYWHQNH